MSRRSAGVLLVGITVLAALVPGRAAPDATAGQVQRGASSVVPGQQLDTDAVWTIAQQCLDARHTALVRTAQRHERRFTVAEALGWCVA
jgi:hypothetical protein